MRLRPRSRSATAKRMRHQDRSHKGSNMGSNVGSGDIDQKLIKLIDLIGCWAWMLEADRTDITDLSVPWES
jgi:hypothetical protein